LTLLPFEFVWAQNYTDDPPEDGQYNRLNTMSALDAEMDRDQCRISIARNTDTR